MKTAELFESGAMLIRDYLGHEQLLMNKGTFIALVKKYAKQEREKAFNEARKLKFTKNPFGVPTGETFLYDSIEDYDKQNLLT